MSLLMWRQLPGEFVVLTDTLATRMDGDPAQFQTKCWALPHLKLMIAGTGFAQVLEQWSYYVHFSMLSTDITMLNNHAPTALRRLWASAMSNPDLPPGTHTVTLYHFGMDEETGALVRYTYRSTSNFESEYGPDESFAVKPPPVAIHESWPENLDEMVSLARQIRVEQDQRPLDDRVSIGGELVVMVMQGGVITSSPVFRWPDYWEMWNKMNALAGVGSTEP